MRSKIHLVATVITLLALASLLVIAVTIPDQAHIAWHSSRVRAFEAVAGVGAIAMAIDCIAAPLHRKYRQRCRNRDCRYSFAGNLLRCPNCATPSRAAGAR